MKFSGFYQISLTLIWLMGIFSDIYADEATSEYKTALDSFDKKFLISEFEVLGAKQTSERWLLEFLDVNLPALLSDHDCLEMTRKLMTTQVFQFASVTLRNDTKNHRPKLFIQLREKWTLIPVVRGGVGGGNDYKYVGVYNTHSFGSLWTLGAEAHQFGRQPTGGVVWARAPQYNGGREVLGLELWREHRRRLFYELGSRKSSASVLTDLSRVRLLYLKPAWWDQSGEYKSGLDLIVSKERPATIERKSFFDQETERLNYLNEDLQSTEVFWRNEFDDLFVDRHFYQGKRLVFSLGPNFEQDQIKASFEADLYFFQKYWKRENLGVHFFLGHKESKASEGRYYLGGLESVRGIPDGYVFGTKAAYANLENRHLILERQYIDIMSVVFFDIGNAADSWSQIHENWQTAAGLGLRFSVPQVYRLSFRIDYAFSLNNPKNNGISAGMNHFFQPHKPL